MQDQARSRPHDQALALDLDTLRGELASRGARLLAIDGPGGSGKSTLARGLVDGWPNAEVVEMDDFYRPSVERIASPNLPGAEVDRERLIAEVLEPLKCGRAGRYQRYDWDEDRLADWHDVPAGAVVVVEGVYSASEPLCGYFDYTIVVECSYEERLRRGVERDGEQMRAVWVDDWMPAEARYFESEKPDARADLVLDGSGSDAGGLTFRILARGRRH